MGTIVYAAENATTAAQDFAVVSSRTTDDGVSIYIKGATNIINGTTVQVRSTLCEHVQAADGISMGVSIRTTILFDDSVSISKS